MDIKLTWDSVKIKDVVYIIKPPKRVIHELVAIFQDKFGIDYTASDVENYLEVSINKDIITGFISDIKRCEEGYTIIIKNEYNKDLVEFDMYLEDFFTENAVIVDYEDDYIIISPNTEDILQEFKNIIIYQSSLYDEYDED